jgi:streptogramin lyase
MKGWVKGGRALRWLLPLAVALCFFAVAPATAETPPADEYSIYGGVGAVARGPDDSVWFSGGEEGKLGRITPDGRLDYLTLDGSAGSFRDLAVAADGTIWGTSARAIERIAPTGKATRFALPKGLGMALAVAVDSSGSAWFTSWRQARKVPDWSEWTGPGYVGRIAPDGRIESFRLPGEAGARNTGPSDIAAGPDGNLWVTDPALGRIDRVAPGGAIASFRLATQPWAITAGPGGALWFTGTGEIGRITTAGAVTEFPLRGGSSGFNIATGPDGNVWFSGSGLAVGRITPWGQVSWFAAGGGVQSTGLAAGAGGSLWVGSAAHPVKFIPNGSIGKIVTGLPGVEVATTEATVGNGRFEIALECGGSPVRGCAGEVEVTAGRSLVAKAAYSMPPESRRTIGLQLSAAASNQLLRQRFQRDRVSAGVEGGAGGSGDVVLRIPHPLRRQVPPRHLVELPLPSGFETGELARGLGGDFWFADQWGDRIARLTPKGKLSSYRLPIAGSQPVAVTRGPLHSMWLLFEGVRRGGKYRALGRITASGRFSEIPLPGEAYVEDVVAGPDGNLWVTRTGLRVGEIDRVTPAGRVTRFPVREAGAIVRGPGGLWFTASSLTIGRITPRGRITRFQVPGRGFLDGLAAGPDGNVWFTHWARKGPPTVGRITPRGRIAEFPIHRHGHHGSTPGAIVAGPDGNLWFGEGGPPRIGRITPRGKITHFDLPRDIEEPGDFVVGPEGNLWFSLWRAEEVGVFGLPGKGKPCPARSASGSC